MRESKSKNSCSLFASGLPLLRSQSEHDPIRLGLPCGGKKRPARYFLINISVRVAPDVTRTQRICIITHRTSAACRRSTVRPTVFVPRNIVEWTRFGAPRKTRRRVCFDNLWRKFANKQNLVGLPPRRPTIHPHPLRRRFPVPSWHLDRTLRGLIIGERRGSSCKNCGS